MSVSLVLFDQNEAVVDAWSDVFLDGMYEGENVAIRHAKLDELTDCDGIVLPGNSYGLMTGGLDLVAKEFFGQVLEATVQKVIHEYFLGELSVGSAFPLTFEEDDPSPFSVIVYAPTMRTPTTLAGTDNVYRATLAALQVVNANKAVHSNKDFTVAMPGMGTGSGKIDPTVAAMQMKAAWDKFCNPELPEHFQHVLERDFPL